VQITVICCSAADAEAAPQQEVKPKYVYQSVIIANCYYTVSQKKLCQSFLA